MTITTYYVTQKSGRFDIDTNAAVHLINDLVFSTGDNRSWDATRALVDSMFDPATQQHYGIAIESEEHEVGADD